LGDLRLDFYDLPSMEAIVRRDARLLALTIDADGITEIARRARGTPRAAIRPCGRVRDYAQVRGDGSVTPTWASQALALFGRGRPGVGRP